MLAGLFFPAPEMWMSLFDPLAQSVTPVTGAIAAGAAGAAAAAQGGLQGGLNLQELGSTNLDPSTFVPVCQIADTFYRSAQGLVLKLAGRETYQEYAPLIAGSLLRVRLEFCVLESFVYESIIPFIKASPSPFFPIDSCTAGEKGVILRQVKSGLDIRLGLAVLCRFSPRACSLRREDYRGCSRSKRPWKPLLRAWCLP